MNRRNPHPFALCLLIIFFVVTVLLISAAKAQVIDQTQTQSGTSAGTSAKPNARTVTRPANTGMKQNQNQKQQQQQAQQQAQTANANNYNSMGVDVAVDSSDITFNNSGNNDTVFVPNNNTESCLRVFGIAVPTKDGAAILGLPWRSSPCDLEASADDAFAQGNIALGWMFKCKMKSNRKAFGSEDACIAASTNTDSMIREIEVLKKQNAALEHEWKEDRKQCDESKTRMGNRLTSCLQK